MATRRVERNPHGQVEELKKHEGLTLFIILALVVLLIVMFGCYVF